MGTTFTLIEVARDLYGGASGADNPEYLKALVELITDATPEFSIEDRVTVARLITGTHEAGEAFL